VYDPYHPWFDPDQFRFDGYPGLCMQWEVLAKLFAPGTPKTFVDRVLVRAGGATIKKSTNHPDKYIYDKDMPAGPHVFMSYKWIVAVQYDEQGNVLDIRKSGQSAYDFFSNCKIGKNYGREWYKQ
jgi:hypothetical protein